MNEQLLFKIKCLDFLKDEVQQETKQETFLLKRLPYAFRLTD